MTVAVEHYPDALSNCRKGRMLEHQEEVPEIGMDIAIGMDIDDIAIAPGRG